MTKPPDSPRSRESIASPTTCAHSLAVLAAAEPPVLTVGTVAHQFCSDTVTRFVDLMGAGAPLSSIVASVVMGSIRLGYAIRDDEIEQDRALVETLTEGE